MNSALSASDGGTSSAAGGAASWQEMPLVVQEQLKSFDRRARERVQEQPLLAVGIALGLGYSLGWLWSRR